jgi:EmrB/QacA subfamily drug resistance transporter
MKGKEPGKPKVALILAGLMASLLLAALDSTIVGTALKTIVNELDGMKFYAWPFTIYMLCSTVAIPISGGLADIMGRKPVLLAGIGAFLLGSALCGASQTMMQLILFRGLQGIGGGVVVSGVFTVVADLFPPEKRGTYTGIVTSMYGLASIIGPLAGGCLTDSLSWRWIFYVNIPVGVAAAFLLICAMPNFRAEGKAKPVDWLGTLALSLALVPMLLAFSWAGRDYAWSSPLIVGMFAFSLLMVAAFLLVESKVTNPMVPLSLFRGRTIPAAFAVAFLTNAVMFAAIMFLPYFVQGVIGSTATTSGAVTAPMMLGLLVMSNITGFLVSRSGRSKPFVFTAFALMALGAWLLSTMNMDTLYSTAVLFMVVLGFGVGASMPVANISAQNAAPREQIGSVTSVVQFFRNIGATVASAVYGTILANSMASGFQKLDMSHIPENVQGLLRNPQIITDAQAVAQIRANVPTEYAGYFNGVLGQAKGVLSNAIHDVFVFCIFVAAAGVLAAFLLKNTAAQPRGKTMAALEPVGTEAAK